MKLYTFSTFECDGYTTANWFFATSKDEAFKLLDESVFKVKDAIQKLNRINKLKEKLWVNYTSLDLEYNINPKNYRIIKIKYPEKYKEYFIKKELERKKILNKYTWKMLNKIEYHYYKFNREEILEESITDLRKRIIEINTNEILPLIQTNGD
jgi:hypothetical protein